MKIGDAIMLCFLISFNTLFYRASLFDSIFTGYDARLPPKYHTGLYWCYILLSRFILYKYGAGSLLFLRYQRLQVKKRPYTTRQEKMHSNKRNMRIFRSSGPLLTIHTFSNSQ